MTVQSPGAQPHEGRYVLQRTMFAAPAPALPDDLYAVIDRGAVTRERDRVLLGPGSRLTTETYFGRFPAAYFRCWTTVRCVVAEVTVAGSVRLTLRASDANGDSVILEERLIDTVAPQTVRLSSPLRPRDADGSMWMDFETADGPGTVQSLRWTSSVPGRGRSSSIVICTYDRPEECLRTLRSLATDADVLDLVDRVCVVDQGRDAVHAQPGFASLSAHYASKLTYLRQHNLGGTGGFTRGLLEVIDAGSQHRPNVLFMDDDILLEPETVLRLAAFADRADRQIIVGGQMLSLRDPQFLQAGAEQADLRKLASARIVPGAVAGIDLTRLLPHTRTDAGYNGWWCCLLTHEVVHACGLPLPYFIKWDDIEYGVRAARQGVPTVTLPGAAVWHPDPASKDTDDWSRYFSYRNALITSAVHGELSGPSAAAVLARDFAVCLTGMQYALAATLLQAVEDFLAGPDVLDDGGVSALTMVRTLRSGYPDASPQEASGVPGGAHCPGADVAPRVPAAAMAVRCFTQLIGRTRTSAVLNAADAQWWRVAAFRTVEVANPDPHVQEVRIRTYDRAAFLRLSVRGVRVLARLARDAPTAQSAWQQAVPQLSSRSNWARLFADHGEAGKPLTTPRGRDER